MHEMLCRPLAIEFDNRMLQVKKQLRVEAGGLVPSFPLLYSKFIRGKKLRADQRGLPNRRRPTPGQSNRKKQPSQATSQPLAEGNAEEAGTHSWRKFLTAVRTRWLDSAWY
jgi:hypothetical protein